MAVPVQIQCPNGHWFTPNASDKVAVCPHCQAQVHLQGGTEVSDDEVLAFLDDQTGADVSQSPSKEPASKGHSRTHVLQRRKKVCPNCHFETSYSFTICPRCGGPLKIAQIEMP